MLSQLELDFAATDPAVSIGSRREIGICGSGDNILRLTGALVDAMLLGATDLHGGQAETLQAGRHDVLVEVELVLVAVLLARSPLIAFVAAVTNDVLDVDSWKQASVFMFFLMKR